MQRGECRLVKICSAAGPFRRRKKMKTSKRIVWRLAILFMLICCFLVLRSDRSSAVAALATCTTCDANLSQCSNQCITQQNQCLQNNSTAFCADQRNTCEITCTNAYSSCLGNCDFDGSGLPPTSSCGKGRTSCELDCIGARQDCVGGGGTDCGQQYQSCVEACCGM